MGLLNTLVAYSNPCKCGMVYIEQAQCSSNGIICLRKPSKPAVAEWRFISSETLISSPIKTSTRTGSSKRQSISVSIAATWSRKMTWTLTGHRNTPVTLWRNKENLPVKKHSSSITAPFRANRSRLSYFQLVLSPHSHQLPCLVLSTLAHDYTYPITPPLLLACCSYHLYNATNSSSNILFFDHSEKIVWQAHVKHKKQITTQHGIISTWYHISKDSILYAFSHDHTKLSELYAGREVYWMALLLMPLHKFQQCSVCAVFQISSEILMGKVSKTAWC